MKTTAANAHVTITPNDKGSPVGKLADAEVHFRDGVLAGLKLIGFAIWCRRADRVGNPDPKAYNVTFPARQYSVNGERRSFALLRPIEDATAQDAIREMILKAFREYGAQAPE